MAVLNVLVTGASSGIGAAVAHAYAQRGARVALFARREQLLEAVAERCRELVFAMKPNQSFFEPPGEHHVVQELLKLTFTKTH